jgi:hypothetical protein
MVQRRSALWLVSGLRWLGHLPGDLRIERGGSSVFVPITTGRPR